MSEGKRSPAEGEKECMVEAKKVEKESKDNQKGDKHRAEREARKINGNSSTI